MWTTLIGLKTGPTSGWFNIGLCVVAIFKLFPVKVYLKMARHGHFQYYYSLSSSAKHFLYFYKYFIQNGMTDSSNNIYFSSLEG